MYPINIHSYQSQASIYMHYTDRIKIIDSKTCGDIMRSRDGWIGHGKFHSYYQGEFKKYKLIKKVDE